jgi:hypothetical protein
MKRQRIGILGYGIDKETLQKRLLWSISQWSLEKQNDERKVK